HLLFVVIVGASVALLDGEHAVHLRELVRDAVAAHPCGHALPRAVAHLVRVATRRPDGPIRVNARAVAARVERARLAVVGALRPVVRLVVRAAARAQSVAVVRDVAGVLLLTAHVVGLTQLATARAARAGGPVRREPLVALLFDVVDDAVAAG